MMKLLYAHENHFMVNNVKNLIEAQQISCFIKNEFAQGAVGEISAFDAWPEVWLVNEADFERATTILTSYQQANKGEDWLCKSCAETNDASFEICWNCQHEHKESL
jgi:hypothetical protein|tara:strand:+ start:691 stop:1008 length:318 start_codon:yes stop_codon:yes gene_type:complete